MYDCEKSQHSKLSIGTAHAQTGRYGEQRIPEQQHLNRGEIAPSEKTGSESAGRNHGEKIATPQEYSAI